MATIAEALTIAFEHHGAGRLGEAENIYRQILAVEPNQPDALHLLGALAHQVGRPDVAVDFMTRAVAAKPDFPEALGNLGLILRDLGRLDEAIGVFRKLIGLDPSRTAIHLDLGNACYRLGRWDEAAGHYRDALALNPALPDAHANLGCVLTDLGRPEEAIASCRAALAFDPNAPLALNNLGNALKALGNLDDAIGHYERAIALDPALAEAHANLGCALTELGRPDEAVVRCRQAIALKPGDPDALYNLGNALRALNRPDQAVASYREAIAADPGRADAYNNLGNALQDLGRFAEAIPCHEAAASLRPDFAMGHNNLANAWKKMGHALGDPAHIAQAVASYRKALEVDPDHAEAHNGLGSVYCQQGDLEPAIEHFDAALARRPDFAEARVNRALALFLGGRLKEAWADYEARWNNHPGYAKRPFAQPWWDGRPLVGETLLVWGEQGLGDRIMGVGMLPEVMTRVSHCIVECEPRLVELFARSFPSVEFVPRQDPPDRRVLAADHQIALFSLGRYFRNDAAAFPGHSGYLVPDPTKAARWKAWLDGLGPGARIGLSWTARLIAPGHLPHFPSMADLSEILGLRGLVFVNIQYGDSAGDIEAMRRDMGVAVHCPPGLDLTNDLDELAALIAGLDAVVGPATAAVVLAGALGRSGWMNAYYPAYCEVALCNRDHVPWCPSIKAETCGFGEDWSGAVGRAAAGLRSVARRTP